MGHYEQLVWQPAVLDGVPRAYRQRGPYWAYVPDPLQRSPMVLDGQLIDLVATATAALSAAVRGAGDVDLDSFASLALRSEAAASSVIEGVQASAKSVALADFTGHGPLGAQGVARNARIMRLATRDLAQAPEVSLDDVEQLQAQLVPHLPGLRQEQVWIGGANPMVAQFVPPRHERVRPLMDDLLAYLNDPVDTTLVAAATIHAQFETIHPFRDGNGRIGRALTHTVLARSHRAPTVIPFSRVFAARKQSYIEGLTGWLTYHGRDGRDGMDGRSKWISAFAEAIIEAAALTQQMVSELVQVQHEFRQALSAERDRAGHRAPRRGSAVLRLLEDVTAHPIDTAATAAARLGVSTVAARDALDELTNARVYRSEKIHKGKTVAYLAKGILNLADEIAARGSSPPQDSEPTEPRGTAHRARPGVCGHPLPGPGERCTAHPGHDGKHRRT
jgi:Fic family protein